MIRRTSQTLASVSVLVGSGLAHAGWALNVQKRETIIAHEIYNLHTVILIICLVIFISVFGAMFYAIWKHRKSVGHNAEQFHENATAEILWTVIPLLILVGMAYPSIRTLLAMRDASRADITIKATAAADADKTFTMQELMAEGEKVYGKTCVACHLPNGQGMPPAFPSLVGGKITTGPIAGHVDIVFNGSKTNPAMVPWKGQLSDLEIAAVVTYERNSFGNKSGDMVQPKDIAALRK